MNNVALLIGGNQGDRRALIKRATELIRQSIGSVVAVSSDFETEPWGDFGEEQPQNFLNRALLVETQLSANEVLEEALLIEAILGRMRPSLSTFWYAVGSADNFQLSTRKYSSRPMDIDLIFFNDEVIDTPDLQIPHPRMHLRRFVLEPLAEIMPDYRHPVLGKTIMELFQSLPEARQGVGFQARVITPAENEQSNGTPLAG